MNPYPYLYYICITFFVFFRFRYFVCNYAWVGTENFIEIQPDLVAFVAPPLPFLPAELQFAVPQKRSQEDKRITYTIWRVEVAFLLGIGVLSCQFLNYVFGVVSSILYFLVISCFHPAEISNKWPTREISCIGAFLDHVRCQRMMTLLLFFMNW